MKAVQSERYISLDIHIHIQNWKSGVRASLRGVHQRTLDGAPPDSITECSVDATNVRDKKDTAFRPYGSAYSGVQFYEDHGYTIHPASDFIARPKRVKKVKATSDALRAFDEMMGSPIEQLDAMTIKPKLVHGLTVKNPTDDEAKMIFDEAKRLGLSTYAEHRIDLPFIWWSVTDTVSRCADSDWPVEQIFVTAKEFVQRMQNGRG